MNWKSIWKWALICLYFSVAVLLIFISVPYRFHSGHDFLGVFDAALAVGLFYITWLRWKQR